MINENLLKNEELAVFRLRELYSGFGYSQFKMSKFEEYDLYVRNKDFLISDRIITFTDTNGKLLALKPDVTLSIINNYSGSSDKIQKMYYSENVYRVSGTNGRFKEIMQTGLECLGCIGIYEISEVVYLAMKSLELIDENFNLELAHASLLTELLSDAGISADKLQSVLDAVSSKSSGLISELYSDGKLNENQHKLINALIVNYGTAAECTAAIEPFVQSEICRRYFNEFITVLNSVSNDSANGRLTVNFSLASFAGYYSGTVFKGYISGIPVSVLSGGQYDKLMKKFGEEAGAVGFAVYLDSFERFKITAAEYDVDTVVIVSEKENPGKVFAFVEKLKDECESVYVCNEIPVNLKYRRVIEMEG